MAESKTERSREELAFLPAALEIQETPPLPISRYILWAIMVFFTIAVIWAMIGQVDIVGVAQGKIVPTGRVKVIQPLESGVVRNIYVKEGQHVKAGESLIELDTTLTSADREQIQDQQLALQLDRARLVKLLNTLDPDNKQAEPDAIPNATAEQLRIMQQRINSQLNEYDARVQALRDEKSQRQAERRAIVERIAQLDSTIPLITERASSLEELLKTNMVPRVQWLELEQERIEQVKERDVQHNNLTSLSASIANLTQREKAQKSELQKQLLTELADVENRLTGFEQELVKAETRVDLQTLSAPVDGTVHQLTVHTIGGVVTPAQELMQIIPGEDAIEVEAWIQNKDIGFVHEGQEAEIKVETFAFTKYGTIDGELINVSDDATPNEQLGLVYAARVKMAKSTMRVNEKIVNLTPGMAVTVEVKMGKRKVIEFVMSPLLRYRDESIRER